MVIRLQIAAAQFELRFERARGWGGRPLAGGCRMARGLRARSSRAARWPRPWPPSLSTSTPSSATGAGQQRAFARPCVRCHPP